MNEELFKGYSKYELDKRNSLVKKLMIGEVCTKYYDTIDLIILNPYVNCPHVYGAEGFNMIAISNRESFHEIDQCLVVKNDYFSIYTKSWSEIESITEYLIPSVGILRNFSAIYKKSIQHWIYYYTLAEKLDTNMHNDRKIYLSISKHFIDLLKIYDELIKTHDFKIIFDLLSKIIIKTEYIIFMLNHSSLPDDLRKVKSEILSFNILPSGFSEIYSNLTNAYTLDEIKKSSLQMIICIKNLLDDLNVQYQTIINEPTKMIPQNKEPLTDEALTGTGELMCSKWRGYMYQALKENNQYLSFMTMAKCQRLYDAMYMRYHIPYFSILEHFNPRDLKWNAITFDQNVNKWLSLYRNIGKTPNFFHSLDDLESHYESKKFYLKKHTFEQF